MRDFLRRAALAWRVLRGEQVTTAAQVARSAWWPEGVAYSGVGHNPTTNATNTHWTLG